MSTKAAENEELIRRYLNAFNEREWDTLEGTLADDVVNYGVHEELHGPDEIVDFLQDHFDKFPDYTGTTEDMVVDEDTVVVRYTASGTHSEEFKDIEPTGKEVEWTGIAMYRVEDGRIGEVWVEENRLDLLEQLEAVDPPAHLRI